MVPDEDIALFAAGYYGRFGESARWRASEQAAKPPIDGAIPSIAARKGQVAGSRSDRVGKD